MEPQQTETNNPNTSQPVDPQQAAPAPAAAPPANPGSGQSAQALPLVPEQWPGAFGVYKYSREAVKLNFVTLAIFWLISAVLGAVLQRLLGTVGDLLSFLLGALASAGFALTFLSSLRGQKLAFGEAFKKSLPFLLKMALLSILVALLMVASLFLFIIPFFFVFPRLSLTNYFLVDKNTGVIGAIKASWAATKGSSGKVWGIIGVTFLMALLFVTLIGIPVAIYLIIMYSGATAVLYEYLNLHPAAQAQPVQAAAPAQPAQPATNPEPVQPTESQPPTNPTPPTV
jgi:hypothetical protein